MERLILDLSNDMYFTVEYLIWFLILLGILGTGCRIIFWMLGR